MRILLVAAVAAAFGCGGTSTAKTSTPVLAQTPPGPAPRSFADPLVLLPADSDFIVKVDIAALRGSALFGKYRALVREFLVPGFASCEYDPFSEITTITAGFPPPDQLGVFVVRGLDRDKTLACLRTSNVDTATQAVFDGEYVSLQNKSGNTNLLKFVDSKTAVVQGSKGPTKETLERALLVATPLRADVAFVAAERRARPGAVLTMISRPGSGALAAIVESRLGARPQGFIATIHLTDVVTVHVAIEMMEAAVAEAIVTAIKPQLAGVQQLLQRYDVRAEDKTVVVEAVVTEEQIKMFVDLAKSMGGAGAPAP